MTVSLVVAYSRNRVIGRDGDLPWHLPTDMRRFRELTTGGTVVMGRRTWESIPARFRPLPDRRNIVVSRGGTDAPEVHRSVDAAIEAAEGDCFVIGGGEIYAQALARAERVYATEVDAEVEGDTLFPELGGWRCVERTDPVEENGLCHEWCVYERG